MLKNESLEPGEADFSVHGDVARSLTRADLMVMVALVAISGVLLILWSHLGDELIPVNNGVAYDSKTYAQITREPLASLFGGLDIHRVQRVVPSLVVFLMLAPFGLHTSTTALLLGFQVLNYTLIALTAVLWWATARRRNWAAANQVKRRRFPRTSRTNLSQNPVPVPSFARLHS